jgi:hypothetical protein
VQTALHWMIVGGTAAAAFLVVLVLAEHGRENGEPFEWVRGVSVWPSTFIRYVALVLSVTAVCTGLWHLQRHCREIWKDTFGFPIGQWSRRRSGRRLRRPRRWPGLRVIGDRALAHERDDESEKDVRHAFLWYCRHGRWGWRLFRMLIMAVIFFFMAFAIIQVIGDRPNNPCRGDTARLISQSVLFLAVLGLMASVFFVVDALRLSKRFVKKLGDANLFWRGEGHRFDEEVRTRSLIAGEDACPLFTVRLIAQDTNIVSKLMLLPFSVLLLMILSRSSIFDYWSMPIGLVIIFLLIFEAHGVPY